MLLIDLGNSRLKWACFDSGGLGVSSAIVHRGADWIAALEDAWHGLPAPTAVYAASVASPERKQVLANWLASHWHCPVHWVTAEASACGVQNGYLQPAQLGVDRWLAILGAWLRKRTAACVVDCGSAITIDILDKQGQHLGGVIAPGVQMMRSELSHGTALPDIGMGVAIDLGRDTGHAIQTGTSLAALGLIEHMWRRAPAGAVLLLTGGDAHQLAAELDVPCEIYPDLVLEGLAGTLNGV